MQGQKEQKVIKKITQNNLNNQAQMPPQEKQKNKTKKNAPYPLGLSLSAWTRSWMFHNTSPHRSQSARAL